MKRSVSDLTDKKFDVLIIGAGITGACLALDASLRGMSVAIIDKGDFGAATSSASSKLLHGGIRYLQQGKLHKVRESALERVYFQILAPHLTRYVPFVIPAYKGIRQGSFLLKSAIMVYEALCLGQNRHITDPSKKIPAWRLMSKHEVQDALPGIRSDAITGGVLFYESHMHNSERMTFAMLDTAARHGAILANYVRAESFLIDTQHRQRICGVRAKDLLSDQEIEIQASIVANAAGPWMSLLYKRVRTSEQEKNVTGYAKGAHIVTKPLTKGYAVALPTKKKTQGILTRGGRHVFIIPWRAHSLIGTTYTPFQGDPDTVRPLESDVAELTDAINQAFDNEMLKRCDIVHAYAGLYGSIRDNIPAGVYQVPETYQIIDHERQNGLPGLISVLGAKYTTARLLAEKALNLIATKFSRPFEPCQTRGMALTSGKIADLQTYRKQKRLQYRNVVSDTVVEHLVTNYGTEIGNVLALAKANPSLLERLSPSHNVLAAEVHYAVEHEMACHLDDFVFRRTGLGTLGNPGRNVITRCAELMGDKMGWSREMREAELHHTIKRFPL